MNKTKLSVSLYCFSQELKSRSNTIEECIEKIAEMGAEGVEIVNAQHLPGFPKVSSQEIEKLKKTIETNDLKLVCFGSYVDTTLKTEDITIAEMTQQIVRDLEFANQLEAPIMRGGGNAPLQANLDAMKAAEKHGVKIGIEVHAPATARRPLIDTTIDEFAKVSNPYLGLIPDFSIFANCTPGIIIRHAIERGAPRFVMKKLIADVEGGVPLKTIIEKGRKKGAPPEFEMLVEMMFHLTSHGTPRELKDMMPHCIHFHGKFWELDKNDEEPNINYKELLAVIEDYGYSGYISSEYEGWTFEKENNGFEITERHQKMMRRYL